MENNRKEALNTFVESLTKEKNEMIKKINSLITSYTSSDKSNGSIDIESGKSVEQKEDATHHSHHHAHHCCCENGVCDGPEDCHCHHHIMMMQCGAALDRIADSTEQLIELLKAKMSKNEGEN